MNKRCKTGCELKQTALDENPGWGCDLCGGMFPKESGENPFWCGSLAHNWTVCKKCMDNPGKLRF